MAAKQSLVEDCMSGTCANQEAMAVQADAPVIREG